MAKVFEYLKRSSKLGFFGATPATRPSAYTQTYSTGNKTIAAPTAVAPAAMTAANPTLSQAAATGGDAPTEAEFNGLRTDVLALETQLEALIVDVTAIRAEAVKLVADDLDNRQAITSIIDDLQTLGLLE